MCYLARIEIRQGRCRTIRHANLVCVQGESDHRVIADERGELDDAGGAVGAEDALIGRVRGAAVAQQLDGVVVDRLLVLLGEAGAALAEGLDGLV